MPEKWRYDQLTAAGRCTRCGRQPALPLMRRCAGCLTPCPVRAVLAPPRAWTCHGWYALTPGTCRDCGQAMKETA